MANGIEEKSSETSAASIESVKKSIKKIHSKLVYGLNPNAKPPVIQELVLAQRHLEDAEFRLDRAVQLASKKQSE